MSGHIRHLSIWHSHVFLVNSRLGHYSAALSLERPFSRSYRTILPSSLTMNHSSALVCSTRPRVSVYSTVPRHLKFSGFSRGKLPGRYPLGRGLEVLSTFASGGVLDYHRHRVRTFNALFRQPACHSSPRHRVTVTRSTGMLTRFSSASPFGLALEAG